MPWFVVDGRMKSPDGHDKAAVETIRNAAES